MGGSLLISFFPLIRVEVLSILIEFVKKEIKLRK